jgi:hypothetical protein
LAEERDRLLAALMTPEERAQALADAEQAEESKSTATKPASKSKKTTTKRKKKPKCRRGIFGKRCRR